MSALTSLKEGYRALLFGASGGIGAAFADRIAADPRCGALFAASRSGAGSGDGRTHALRFDLEDEGSIADAVNAAAQGGPIDLVIIATGLLHDDAMAPERSARAMDADQMARAFRINAIGPALIAKYALGHMPREEKAVFAALSARVSSVSDNRLGGWHSYRASKAALNMLVRNAALELARRNPAALCVALHPGTVETAMSAPFRANVPPGRLFTAEESADHLLRVIDRLTPADTGGLYAWDGSAIPF